MAYSARGDLLLGNLPLPSYLDVDKMIEDASNEIDSKIGFIYETPVDVTPQSGLSRPAKLLLARINNYLASGRILMAVATSGEDSEVNAYGMYLVREATRALNSIVSGDITLDGATLLPTQDAPFAGPVAAFADAGSAVDTFYNDLTSPDGLIDPSRSPAFYFPPRRGG